VRKKNETHNIRYISPNILPKGASYRIRERQENAIYWSM